VRAEVMTLGDDALHERAVLRVTQEIAGKEETRLDVRGLERVQDVAGAFAEIAAGEDERELLDRRIAARRAALDERPVWMRALDIGGDHRCGGGRGGHGNSRQE